jgi:basic amino acid/polyamine antiporter, APA family
MTDQKISLLTATAIVVANMIGTGVFTSLGFQVISIHTDFSLLALWLVGGLAALCGALSYAELATALPRLGGEYNFLSRIYHPAVGFMAGWVSATVGFSAPIALAAMAFGTYFNALAPWTSPIALSLILVWVVTLILLFGFRAGSMFQDTATVLKIGLILILIVAGLTIGPKQPLSLVPTSSDWPTLFSAPFAVSLVYVMYSYSGWNAASYITSEVRNAEKNVPLALAVGTVVVTVLYILLNAIFLLSAPKQELAGQLQVAVISGAHIFGPIGAGFASALVSFGLIASVSAMSWIGSRVTKAMADDFPRISFFGRVNQHQIPYVAIVFQSIIVTFLILTASFETVLLYVQFSLLACSLLAVLGLIVLRIREPELKRPYRVWLYPFTPILFIGLTLWMMWFELCQKPFESGLGLITVLLGLVVYYLVRKGAANSSHAPGSA